MRLTKTQKKILHKLSSAIRDDLTSRKQVFIFDNLPELINSTILYNYEKDSIGKSNVSSLKYIATTKSNVVTKELNFLTASRYVYDILYQHDFQLSYTAFQEVLSEFLVPRTLLLKEYSNIKRNYEKDTFPNMRKLSHILAKKFNLPVFYMYKMLDTKIKSVE